MTEDQAGPQKGAPAAGSAQAVQLLRNVLVLAVADGTVTKEEKAYVEALRERLGIGGEEFARLCGEVRNGGRKVVLPRGPVEAEQALFTLVGLAVADGKITAPEQRLLGRLGEHLGIGKGQLETMVEQASGPAELDDMRVADMTEEVYEHFARWDEATRRAKIQALGDLGRGAVKPLVRLLESYRKPDGMPDAVSLKVLVAEQFGRLGDSRPVYYLAQHVDIGDIDDEITSLELRATAAEAIGRIIGQPFTRDQDGVTAVRRWWRDEGRKKYDYLMQ